MTREPHKQAKQFYALLRAQRRSTIAPRYIYLPRFFAFALMIYRASQTRNTGPAVKPHRNTSPRPFKHRRPQHLTATQSCRPPINEETCEQYQRLSGRIEHACAGGTQANATRASGSTTCLRHQQLSQARHLASCRHNKHQCAAHLNACKHLLTIPSQSQTQAIQARLLTCCHKARSHAPLDVYASCANACATGITQCAKLTDIRCMHR